MPSFREKTRELTKQIQAIQAPLNANSMESFIVVGLDSVEASKALLSLELHNPIHGESADNPVGLQVMKAIIRHAEIENAQVTPQANGSYQFNLTEGSFSDTQFEALIHAAARLQENLLHHDQRIGQVIKNPSASPDDIHQVHAALGSLLQRRPEHAHSPTQHASSASITDHFKRYVKQKTGLLPTPLTNAVDLRYQTPAYSINTSKRTLTRISFPNQASTVEFLHKLYRDKTMQLSPDLVQQSPAVLRALLARIEITSTIRGPRY